jgi:cystathionine beta-lyase/cystathionine gamma-synthase
MKDLSKILNQIGEDRDAYYNAVSPPIFQTSNFCFKSVKELRNSLDKEYEIPFYTRGHNPTVGILRKKLAALEGTEDALVFASGCAAIAAAVMSTVKKGDHVICVKKPYSWTQKLFSNYLVDYGVETDMIDGTDLDNFRTAIRENTKLIYLETPNSVTFELQDLKEIAKLAREHQITTVCDNSYSTPLYQRPAELGIDLVVHSASKYIGGHSDLVGGVLCGSKERVNQIFGSEFMTIGGIISPNEAWLMIRGLRTLGIRLERSATTAEKVVSFLENHPKVERVLFPFSKTHPQKALARQQMKGCGGLFSFVLKAEDITSVEKFCDGLNLFLLACSWGGHESLIFPTCALFNSSNYRNSELPWSLVRMYVGLEEPEELIADIEQALKLV